MLNSTVDFRNVCVFREEKSEKSPFTKSKSISSLCICTVKSRRCMSFDRISDIFCVRSVHDMQFNSIPYDLRPKYWNVDSKIATTKNVNSNLKEHWHWNRIPLLFFPVRVIPNEWHFFRTQFPIQCDNCSKITILFSIISMCAKSERDERKPKKKH